MRSLRKAGGVVLILLGFSGLGLTAMVVQEPVATLMENEADPLDPPAPASMDTLTMGLAFAGMTAAGAWLLRSSRR